MEKKLNESNAGFALSREWNPTKSEIRRLTESLTQRVVDGEYDALSAFVVLKALGKAVEDAEKILSPYAIDESHSYNQHEKIFVRECELKRVERGVKYDYASCGDPVWNELKTQMDELQKKIKDREEILKALKEKIVTIDVRTGEVIELNPPLQSSTTTIQVTYPK
jgi:hypothetical protein